MNTEHNKLLGLFELFIKQKKHAEGKSKITIRNYTWAFNYLLRFKPDLQLEDFTHEFFIRFFEFVQNRPKIIGKEVKQKEALPSSVLTIRTKIQSFLTWLLENGYVDRDPLAAIAYPKVTYTDTRHFTDKEFDMIWALATYKLRQANELLRKRNMAMLSVLVGTGVRRDEHLGLKISDLNFDSGMLTIRAETSKSKVTRRVPMDAFVKEQVRGYLKARGGHKTPFLWVSGKGDCPLTSHGLKHWVDSMQQNLGTLKFHLHRFRHTFAVRYYIASNHDIVGLQRLMGHKDIQQTLSYLRGLQGDASKDAIERMRLANIN